MRVSGLDAIVRQQVPMKLHPLTGEPLVEWVLGNGKVVRPIMGAAEDGEEEEEDPPGDGGTGGDDQDKKSTSGGDSDKVDKADLDAMERRMKAADKRAADLQKKIDEADNAKKDELTKATDELTSTKAELEKAMETITSLRLQNSFLTANKHTWHDGDTALALAQSKGYLEDVVDEDGKVDKVLLGKALDKLAKEHAYLVKTENKEEEPDDGPSGAPGPGRSDNNKDEAARRQQLKRRFPALNR